jgi:methylenetetrahydrofolate dehydrogenase (NADP+)/methenyltetrahydrofolate cyclohydrolase
MAEIFDGNGFAKSIEKSLKERLDALGNPELNLHTIFIGNNVGSEIYIRIKEKSLKRLGGRIHVHRFPDSSKRNEIIDKIEELNQDKDVHGIMLELPLPKGHRISDYSVRINPMKDIDSLHPENIGMVLQGIPRFYPPTPSAVMKILDKSGMELKGAEICVVNHSPSIGRPLSMLLLEKNATVHICHVFTKNLKEHTYRADAIVVAAGVPKLITADMVKDGVVVIDVGMNRVNGNVVGDVDFENVKKKAGFITPVPGGVGPVTRYTLFENLLKAYEMSNESGRYDKM